jgi:SAM-dependent methyltransferase
LDKYKILNRIKELFSKNENIIKYLKQLDRRQINTTEDILISYDFQAGTYTDQYENNPVLRRDLNDFSRHLASILDGIGGYKSILEIGIGEATIFGTTIPLLNVPPQKYYGFDISWSRIKYAKRFLKKNGLENTDLFTGDLFDAPLKDNSIDVVFTAHSLEPNGGREREALQELYRITNKYLILIEPAYELADDKAKERMLANGYVTNLYSTAKELNYDVIEHRLFDVNPNPLNPAGLIIIRKNDNDNIEVDNPLCCPITKSDLIKYDNVYYSPDSLLAYPIVDGIPCLLPQNAILATKFLD